MERERHSFSIVTALQLVDERVQHLLAFVPLVPTGSELWGIKVAPREPLRLGIPSYHPPNKDNIHTLSHSESVEVEKMRDSDLQCSLFVNAAIHLFQSVLVESADFEAEVHCGHLYPYSWTESEGVDVLEALDAGAYHWQGYQQDHHLLYE